MALHRLLQNVLMEPADIERLTAAYRQTLKDLSRKDRDDPLTEIIARRSLR